MKALQALLEKEKSGILAFINTLREEQAALSQGDTAALEPLIATKSSLIEELNQLEAARKAIAVGAAVSPDRIGMTRWLESQPQGKTLLPIWQDILQLASEARQIHDLSGKLIAAQLSRTSEALNILTGHSNRAALYGSDGQAAGAKMPRIVDSA